MAIINNDLTLSSIVEKNRFDSEYFQPEYVENERCIRKVSSGYRRIGSLAYITDGDHSVRKYTNEGIPFLTSENFSEFNIDYKTDRYISPSYELSLKRSRSEKDAIFITKTGRYYGKAAICLNDNLVFNIPADVGKIKVLSYDISPFFLVAYLNSKYGYTAIRRQNSGGTRDRITLVNLKNVEAPTIKDELIEEIVKSYINKLEESKDLYVQAQQLLEDELGLKNLVLEKPKSYESSFSEIVSGSRVDAEYYNPQANEIYQVDCFNNSISLKNMFSILRGQTPTQYFKEGTPVLKTKNIRIPIIDETKVEDFSNLSGNYTTIKNGDLILAAMGVGSLGRISYVFDDSSKAIIDGTLRILRAKEGFNNQIIPALLFLTSEYGQILIYKGIIGSTGIISLPDSHLKTIKIPIISSEAAEEITEMVLSSYNARKESEQLLEQAKRRVEELIEGGTGA